MNEVIPEHGHSNDGTSRSKSNPYKFNKP